jgi:hypothetical protein
MLAGAYQHNILAGLWRKKRPTWAEYFRALMPGGMKVRPIKKGGKTRRQLEKQRRRSHRRSTINGVRAIRRGP